MMKEDIMKNTLSHICSLLDLERDARCTLTKQKRHKQKMSLEPAFTKLYIGDYI